LIEIAVFTIEWEEIFSQVLKLKDDKNSIYITDDFSTVKDNWIYFKLDSLDYSYYKIPITANYNPWSLAIYKNTDTNKTPLFAILKDSRIKVSEKELYKLEYSIHDEYIVLKLIDKSSSKEVWIWEILLKIDNSYVIK
jgi:hypothetical protein